MFIAFPLGLFLVLSNWRPKERKWGGVKVMSGIFVSLGLVKLKSWMPYACSGNDKLIN